MYNDALVALFPKPSTFRAYLRRNGAEFKFFARASFPVETVADAPRGRFDCRFLKILDLPLKIAQMLQNLRVVGPIWIILGAVFKMLISVPDSGLVTGVTSFSVWLCTGRPITKIRFSCQVG